MLYKVTKQKQEKCFMAREVEKIRTFSNCSEKVGDECSTQRKRKAL
jgi:hypothetical protein